MAHATFDTQTVREYVASDEETALNNEAADASQKLQAFQRGSTGTPRTRKISYVQHRPGGSGSGSSSGGVGRIADLVVLNEYDEDGNLAHKGMCIVKGVQRKFAAITPARNPMTQNKDGSAVRVEMQYQIIASKEAPTKSRRPSSARQLSRQRREPMQLDSDEVPQLLNKSHHAVNKPAARTRPEAMSWMETHKEGSSYGHRAAALRGNSMLSINFPVAASLYQSIKSCPKDNATISDYESASKTNSAFKERDSFKERENVPMSKRRALARQPPARQRVRHNPTFAATQRAVVPRVDKTSPPVSPRGLEAKGNLKNVRFDSSYVMSLASAVYKKDAEENAIHHSGKDEHVTRLFYSPDSGATRSTSNLRPSSAPSRPPPRVPPLSRGFFFPSGKTAVVGVGGGGIPSFGSPHVSSTTAPPARRPSIHLQRPPSSRNAAASSGGITGDVSLSGGVGELRVRSAPQGTGATGATMGGGGDAGVLSARTVEAQRVSVMMKHVNAAFAENRITDKVWCSALSDLESKTRTPLELINRVVYIKKGGDSDGGPTYERTTHSASLKLRIPIHTERCLHTICIYIYIHTYAHMLIYKYVFTCNYFSLCVAQTPHFRQHREVIIYIYIYTAYFIWCVIQCQSPVSIFLVSFQRNVVKET